MSLNWDNIAWVIVSTVRAAAIPEDQAPLVPTRRAVGTDLPLPVLLIATMKTMSAVHGIKGNG